MKTIISTSAGKDIGNRAQDKQKWMEKAAKIDKLWEQIKKLQDAQRKLSPKKAYTKVRP